jgi:hypothetical protein
MREIVMPASMARLPDDPQALPKWKWHEPVCYAFPRRWHRLVRGTGLTERTYWLFWALLAHMGWENRVTESVAIVGREAGLASATVSRCLHRLERAGLVVVERTHPSRPVVTISPFLVWQGRPHLLYKAREAFEERCRQSRRARRAASTHQPQETEEAPSRSPSRP